MLKAALFFLLISSLSFTQNLNRYTDSTFNYNQVVTNGIYATAPELNSPYQSESATHQADLSYHLFAPENDTLILRPLLIAIHGGGFVSGNKEHDDMIEFCKLFADRGYVTVTIQYRLGMNMLSKISSERAVYRGVQDGRAAIRYFKENADLYGIDTNYIYLLGSSAGAFVSLHNLFMNEESERPAGTYELPTFPISPDLDSLDAINPTLKHGSHPNGVISLWGAIQTTELIKVSDGNVPLFLVHGMADSIVPFDVGSPYGSPILPKTYGSKPINEYLINLGFNNETYFVPDEGHEFYGVSNGMWSPVPNEYWDTVVTKSTNFLWEQHKPTAKFVYTQTNGSSLWQFTDSSFGATKWEWDFGDGTKSIEQNPTHTFPDWGDYLVRLTIQNGINSWDTTSAIVRDTETNVADDLNFPLNFELSQNYPNPFGKATPSGNPTTTIKYSIPTETQLGALPQRVTLKIYDILGREVKTLVNKREAPGRYEVMFNVNSINGGLTSGIYFYKLVSNNITITKKMMLLR